MKSPCRQSYILLCQHVVKSGQTIVKVLSLQYAALTSGWRNAKRDWALSLLHSLQHYAVCKKNNAALSPVISMW